MITATVLALDPYDSKLGVLTHLMIPRLKESFEQLGMDQRNLTSLMSRLLKQDPSVLLIAVLGEGGKLIGHCGASIDEGTVFVLQPRLDEPTSTDTVGEMLSLVEQWVKGYNQLGGHADSWLTLLTKRLDSKWAKKHGFVVKNYVLEREIKE